MYFNDLIRGLLRRWYVLLAGLLLAGLGVSYVYAEVPVQYEAESTLMLLPPQDTLDTIDADNPYLVLGGLGQALAVLNTRLNAQELRERLTPADADAYYGSGTDTNSGAAFLMITVEGESDTAALRLLDDVETAAEEELAHMQQELGVEEVSTIELMHVTTDVEATAVASTRMQLTVAAAAVGIVGSIVLTAAVEGLATARSRRKAAIEMLPPRERDPLEPLRARDVPRQEAARPRERRAGSRGRTRTAREPGRMRSHGPSDEGGSDSGAAADEAADASRLDEESLSHESRR